MADSENFMLQVLFCLFIMFKVINSCLVKGRPEHHKKRLSKSDNSQSV